MPAPKVLYDYDVFNRQHYGGIGRYFIELIRYMPPEEADVRLIAGLHINYMLRDVLPGCGIRVPSLPKTATVREYINQRWLLRECRAWRPRIIHKTFFCRQELPRGVKLAITIHDLATARFPQYFPATERQTAAIRYWAGRADAVIAVSETTKSDAADILGIPRERIAVVYHGVERPAGVREASPHARPYLLYVGQRYPYKNFGNLLRAYAASDRIRQAFDLISFGGAELSAAERLPGVHHRQGDDAMLFRYYQHARALVSTSIYEGFGLPLVEAMSAGCPLISSDIPASREVAGDAAVYFPPEDAEAIAAALERTLFDDTLLAQNVAAGQQRAKLFSWSKCAAETAAVYRAL